MHSPKGRSTCYLLIGYRPQREKFILKQDAAASDGWLFSLANSRNSHLELDSKFQHPLRNVNSLLFLPTAVNWLTSLVSLPLFSGLL